MGNDRTDTGTAAESRWQQYWQAETVRLREAHWGPLEDQAARQAALRDAPDLTQRILTRARWLATRNALTPAMDQWRTGARWALVLLWAFSALAGIGAAAAVLNSPGGSINLALALVALLGLHGLTFLIWLIGCLPGVQASSALSRLWLWISRRLARGPDHALAAQAFLSLLIRARAWKAAIGLISHGAWTLFYLCALGTLMLLLSTRSVSFHWETTLLDARAFQALSQALGSVPQWLGFPTPDGLAITQSMVGSPTQAAASVQSAWSWWLIGCVLVWGLLPRVLGLLVCAVWLRQRLHALHIDPDLPGWLELRERLMPTHDALGIDHPAPAHRLPQAGPTLAPTAASAHAAVMAYELGPDLVWPPADLPASVRDLGRCDSRADRARIRAGLDVRQLLLICDARLTPDRGTASWLQELSLTGPALQVLCLEGSATRREIWTQALARQGIQQATSLADWLTQTQEASHG